MKLQLSLLWLLAVASASGADLDRGETLSSQLCFNCHGPKMDGKLSPEEHLNIFRSQFPKVDVNKDGIITAADKRKK